MSCSWFVEAFGKASAGRTSTGGPQIDNLDERGAEFQRAT